MGTSFVHIGEKGFWMRDSILELWLRLLALHIADPEEESIGQQIRDGWLLASRGYFLGHVPVRLEEAVSTDEGRRIVLAAIESLMIALERGATRLDHGTLNLLGFYGGQFTGEVEANRLIEVGKAFRSLLAGEIETDARSTEFMPGSMPAT